LKHSLLATEKRSICANFEQQDSAPAQKSTKTLSHAAHRPETRASNQGILASPLQVARSPFPRPFLMFSREYDTSGDVKRNLCRSSLSHRARPIENVFQNRAAMFLPLVARSFCPRCPASKIDNE
jgi:hypothetical protein